jgi:mono/diheme cytochrome c family protein
MEWSMAEMPPLASFQSKAVWLLAGFALVLVLASASYVSMAANNAGVSPDGEQVYQQNHCFVCHGGLGGGDLGPRLAGDPILAIGQFVVAQIILGRGEMPAFGDKLKDDQIAAVAQYVRTQWGNDFGPVTPQNVAEVRNLMNTAVQTASRVSQPQQ